MANKHYEAMTKKELVEEAYRLGLGPFRAALDVLHKGELQRKILNHLR